MTKFEPGMYRTRGGSRAEVFKEADGKLWGRATVSTGWLPFEWNLAGQVDERLNLVAPWKEELEAPTWANLYADRIHVFSNRSDAERFKDSNRIACRRIRYRPGKRLSEEECLEQAWSSFREDGTMTGACEAYLSAYGVGRIMDTTPEGDL